MHNGVTSSTHVRVSNVIRREEYDLSEDEDIDEVQSIEASSINSSRSESSSEIDEVLRNVMQQVDAEIQQCVVRGKPLTSILSSPPGRARKHRQPFSEHTASSSNVDGAQQRLQRQQLPRGSSSRCPPSTGSMRWLDTPHAVSVTRGMRGTQQLMLFDHDARVRQAYQRARWMSRAQQFRIALDVNDPKVQQSLQLAVQPFDFQVGGRAPPVHIAGIDHDIEEEDELPDFSP